MFRPIKNLLHEHEVNLFLRENQDAEGFEFVERVLDYFNCSYRVVGRELEQVPSEGAVALVVNRGLGLLDAAVLLKLLGTVRRDIRIAADGLAHFTPLRSLLIPNQALRAALDDGVAVIVSKAAADTLGAATRALPVHVGGRSWIFFSGMSAFLRQNVVLPVTIGSARVPQGRIIGLRAHVPVAHAEDGRLVRRDLKGATLLGQTTDGKQILLFDAGPDSAVLRELGRLREVAFRQIGEGTGKRRDVDRFDAYYRHVVLWDDAELQIAGAYRIGEAANIARTRGEGGLYTHGLFSYSDELRAMFPQALELGRSFVQPRYQGLRALDYLWQGIGSYLASRPDVRYLFGPVSISASYPEAARRMLVYFYQRHYGTERLLAAPRRPFRLEQREAQGLAALFPGRDFPAELRVLKEQLAALGVSIPVLYKQYCELCEAGGTRFLAFNEDPSFANCVDGLVIVDLGRLKAIKRERYVRSAVPTTRQSLTALKSA